MAFRSFRHFLEELERTGELLRINEPVDTDLVIAEWANREMKSPGGGKALLFEKPTIDGKTSAFPVAINTMGSRKRIAMEKQPHSVLLGMRRKLLHQDRLQIPNPGPLIASIRAGCDFSQVHRVSKINLSDFARPHFSVLLRNIDPERLDVSAKL